MTPKQQLILSAALAALAALIALSIAGAFLGAARAAELFNSLPMMVFWILLAWRLLAGLVCFRRLLVRPGLLAVHAGGLLVLVGGMLGSAAGHALLGEHLGIHKAPRGAIILVQGYRTDEMIVGADERGPLVTHLPFEVYLADVRLQPEAATMPATMPAPARPAGAAQDCAARLLVFRDGRQVAEGVLSVNHPLHYGGYHIYLADHDAGDGPQVFLTLHSDTGLYLVYTGLALLCGGMVWQFYVPTFKRG